MSQQTTIKSHSQQRGRNSAVPYNNGECGFPPENTIGLSILRWRLRITRNMLLEHATSSSRFHFIVWKCSASTSLFTSWSCARNPISLTARAIPARGFVFLLALMASFSEEFKSRTDFRLVSKALKQEKVLATFWKMTLPNRKNFSIDSVITTFLR